MTVMMIMVVFRLVEKSKRVVFLGSKVHRAR